MARYQTLTEFNASGGFNRWLLYPNQVTFGLFTPMLLFAIFMISWLGYEFTRQRRTGTSDFAGSFTVAGFVTFGSAMALSLIPGMVSPLHLTIIIVVLAVGMIWLFTSRE